MTRRQPVSKKSATVCIRVHEKKLAQVGIHCGNHKARHLEKSDYDQFDYIIGMDSANMKNIARIAGNDYKGKVYKLLQFAGETGDIADP